MTVTGSLLVSGSGTFTNIGPAVFSGSITSTAGFTGSFSGTATSASYADIANSASYATSASNASSAATASYVLNAISASYANNATLADNSTLFNNTASTVFATTGSNTFVGTQYVSNTNNATGFSNTTSSIYTDGGLQVTKDAYFSSSMFIKGNLTVYGTQSVNFITSSQLNISTNLITVNTSTPSVRFGGLAVQDSGSTGLTGSILWDSQENHWVYTNPSGSSYSGGMFISGPRASSLGSEQGTTLNAIMKGQGGDHITSSGMFESGSNVGIGTSSPNTKLEVAGTIRVSSNGTNGGDWGIDDSGIAISSRGSTPIAFWTDDFTNHRMRITSGGSVGIGTSSPKSYSSLTTTGQIIALNNIGIDYGQSFRLNNYYNSGTGTDRTISTGYASSIGLDQSGGGLVFNVSSATASADNNIAITERMRITSAGNVGIGIANPVGFDSDDKIVQIYNPSTGGSAMRSMIRFTNTTSGATWGNGTFIGIDLGISSLVITSDGDKVSNPKHFNKHYRRLRKAQKNLSRKQKGSKNREKAKILHHLLGNIFMKS